MSIQNIKEISPTLSNLIAEANYTLENAKDKILAVYNYAVNKDNYTPQEARDLVEKKIVNVTNRYIRKILPDEAKDQSKKHLYLNHDEEQVPHSNYAIPDPDRDRSNEEKPIHIPPAHVLKDAETDQEEEPDEVEKLGNQNLQAEERIPEEPFAEVEELIRKTRELDTVNQLLTQARETIQELEKTNNKLEIEVVKLTETKSGPYELEIKDKIIPLNWKYDPTNEKDPILITFDMQKGKRLGV